MIYVPREMREFDPIERQIVAPLEFINRFGHDSNRRALMDRDGIFSAQHPWTAIMDRIFRNGLPSCDGHGRPDPHAPDGSVSDAHELPVQEAQISKPDGGFPILLDAIR